MQTGLKQGLALAVSVGLGMVAAPQATQANEVDDVNALSAELQTLRESYVKEVRRLREVDARLLAIQAQLKAAGVQPDGQTTRAEPSGGPTAASSNTTAGETSEVGHTAADKEKATKRSVDDFLQQEHVAFDRRLVIEGGITYSRYDRNQLALNGFLALDSIFLGNISVDKVASDTLTYSLAARYSLTPRWNIGVSTPFLQRQITYQKGGAGGSAASYAELSQGSTVTPGDTTFNLSYRLLPETQDWPDIVLTGSVIAPTGRAPYGISWETINAGQDASGNSFVQFSVPTKQATGNGLWGYGVSLSMVKTMDPALIFTNFGYTGYLSRHFNDIGIDPSVQNPGRVKLGESFSYALGLAFALNDRASLSLSVSDQISRQARIKYDGQPWQALIGSNANAATFNLGMTYALNKRTTLVTTLGVGLTPDAPDFTLGIKIPFIL
ncbi:hypothetical protein A9404_05710 [Halothiobacillus diazotrophicus]|uniref:Transporter n=2 Tax=Halothiobacillus diazotrophicus TaxID=1860122 RepID=A0A191ZGF8_9GAMM|nr:hypothetical protein A9404_05710 [Halothiobacillus diazotrophicus]